MNLISFQDWLQIKESSSHTRARGMASKGLMPPQTVGSLHGRSTASPKAVKSWEDTVSKKKKRKSKKNKK